MTDESNRVIPEEHNIDRWTSFLPPLRDFKINPRILQNITKEFKDSLMRSLKTESFEEVQREKLMVIESKIIYFSLGIQEKIQNILKHEILLLPNTFLENACCDENNKNGNATIQYFADKDGEIPIYNKIVQDLSNILEDIDNLTKAVYLRSNRNTKKVFPPLSDTYEEITIYKTFMNVCKFNNLMPISEELLLICHEKPKYLLNTDTTIEKIAKMKQHGLTYTNEMFLQLLKVKDRENIISIPEFNPTINPVHRLQNIVEYIEEHPVHIISPGLLKLLSKLRQGQEQGREQGQEQGQEQRREQKWKAHKRLKDEEERREQEKGREQEEWEEEWEEKGREEGEGEEQEDLINYLMETNDAFKIKIYEFIISNSSLTKTQKIELKNSVENICINSSISFIKQYMHNFTTIFPNIILNKIDYSAFRMPKYFGLSQYHSNDIKNIVDKFYKSLRKFYGDNVLTNILDDIKSQGINLTLLINELPNQTLLFEHLFLSIFMEYIHLIDKKMVRQGVNVEDEDFTSELVEESDLKEQQETAILLGNKKMMKIAVTNLLLVYFNIMTGHHEMVNLDASDIMDIVFKIRQKEKDTFTDRLKSITVEDKDVDTMLKKYKLGVWSKGLQKGLTIYDKDTYDEDRDEMEKLVNIENKLLKNKRKGIDTDSTENVNDYIDNEINAEAIDKEDNDLNNLYGDGDDDEERNEDGGDGDEFENTGYIED